MSDRRILSARGVVPAVPNGGGGSTPSFAVPPDAGSGLPGTPLPTTIGGRRFAWGERTYVMGIVNVTPDSFSGDGLLAGRGATGRAGAATGRAGGAGEAVRHAPAATAVDGALELAARMVAEGADLLDVGGESSRPGHAEVDAAEEIRRVVPVIAALHGAFPGIPISVDTIKPEVAAAAIEAGAAVVNDVWGVADDDRLARLAAERHVPIVLMHNRAEARYVNLVAEVIADLQRAIDRALRAGCRWDNLIVDPGFGFGKAPEQNVALLRGLSALRVLGRPVLLGTSRKSTLGWILDLPPTERLEATLATTVLGVAAGVDIVRVHDVRENVRAARVADAIVRGTAAAILTGSGTPAAATGSEAATAAGSGAGTIGDGPPR